ncbi:Tyramine beta-hydroxylase [Caenorhabditis elegans]|uniref:Tyramine beta-hydroxylase n=1 Tax=Caenorhabditis elegans TaxID=6239 RepID=A0A0K3ATC0_CAEEL|nr:DOMON domain-containing protein [Caenorhabditis elegans]CTQ87076.1 DOMON domain-containing protein [Caenorhabditis elegans]|eukprot:NP_001300365.1 Tyramine beta-hydroxylase [Caenorhabditis elegans]
MSTVRWSSGASSYVILGEYRKMRSAVALLFLLVAYCGGVVHAGEIVAELYHTNVTVKWHTDYERQLVDFSIWFGASTPDVLFLGFSDFGDTNNSDVLMYYNSKKEIKDAYTNRDFKITSDLQQDFQLLRKRKDHIVVRRKLTTCDSRDYAFLPGTTQFYIAASWGSTNLVDIRDKRWVVDKKFGKVIEGPTDQPNIEEEPAALEKDVKVVIVNSNSPDPIPNVETTYKCIIRKMPFDTVNNMYHVVRMEPYVTPGNEHLVHHMEIFMCRDEVEEWSGSCNDPKKPPKSKSCSHVIAAWAMGEGPIHYPKEAGLPIGGKGKNAYVMVEIHYNNPELHKGVIDSSGFQFFVTGQLRKYDAGIMELGLIYSDANSVPPNQKAWAMNGYCPSQCTKNLPEEGINIFASQLHAHLTGRKLFTSQYRSGVRIGDVNRDEHYSPHWQHLQQLRPVVKVMPGDTLVTTCVYDTRKRSKVTFGGYRIVDEMCVNYIYYYPASDVEVCKSAISNSTLRAYFSERHGMDGKRMQISDMYSNVKDWGNGVDEEFYNVLNVGNMNMNCLKSNGEPFEFESKDSRQSWENMARPTFVSGSFITTRDRFQCPAINDMINFE